MYRYALSDAFCHLTCERAQRTLACKTSASARRACNADAAVLKSNTVLITFGIIACMKFYQHPFLTRYQDRTVLLSIQKLEPLSYFVCDRTNSADNGARFKQAHLHCNLSHALECVE